jgi:hypothetical protein
MRDHTQQGPCPTVSSYDMEIAAYPSTQECPRSQVVQCRHCHMSHLLPLRGPAIKSYIRFFLLIINYIYYYRIHATWQLRHCVGFTLQ